MLNRVMTKDNIGVAVLLEVNKDMFSGGKDPRWDPSESLGENGRLEVGTLPGRRASALSSALSGMKAPQERQLVLVANAHMHWDPEYSDVKLIQTMMFLSELKSIAERASGSAAAASPASDPSAIPIVLCADLNSLPDSGTARRRPSGRRKWARGPPKQNKKKIPLSA